MFFRKAFFVVSCAAVFAAVSAAKVVDRTIAIVNGEAIMSSEFERTIEPVVEQYRQVTPMAEQTKDKQLELKQKLLDQMIDDKILKQEAKKKKVRVSKRDVDDGIRQVKKRFETESEFQAELEKEDISMAQFEKRIEGQLMVMKLIEQEIKGKAEQPAEEEVRAFYDKIQKKMDGKDLGLDKKEEEELQGLSKYLNRITSEQVRAKHILVAVPPNSGMSVKSQALKKIKKIQAELKKSGDFDALAAKYSDDPGSRDRGGDLGYFVKGDMTPEFEKAAFALAVGEVSQPVLTDFGYHIIKVEEKRAAKKINYEDLKNDLMNYIAQKNIAKKYEAWLKDLRAKSNIKINSIE
ncbi:MAG: peptidylprolyl isomerase [Endomicrobiales bacterium]|nr:peptidylprolyl isomerase [Endomicrobiales bacterium]